MAGKPTSMAAMVAKQEEDQRKAALEEDAKLARQQPPEGKVWVRLARPHYDRNGIHHDVGPALLDEGFIPSTAKKLTVAQAEELSSDDE